MKVRIRMAVAFLCGNPQGFGLLPQSRTQQTFMAANCDAEICIVLQQNLQNFAEISIQR